MIKKITLILILSSFFATSALASVLPNDLYYPNQWYLSKISANKAWSKINSSPDVIIAVIDSGVDIDHPDLVNNIWQNKNEIAGTGVDNDGNGFIDDINGWDFVNNVSDPRPKFLDKWTESGASHGTLVAGIIAASGNNEIGIAGISWKAQIMPLKAFNDRGEGRVSDIIRAIDYATNNGAHIINLSFMNFDYSEALQDAIARAHNAGVIIVSAAGNDLGMGQGYNTSEKPIYPACYDGKLPGENMVIGVAATDALDQKSTFSAYGTNCIDISAPGISFFGLIAKGANLEDSNLLYDGYWSGTSMAAPLVSGTLALIMQANPELSRHEVVSILFASTDNINNVNPEYQNMLGNGRLNVDRAVSMAKQKLYKRTSSLIILPSENVNEKEVSLRSPNGELRRTLETEVFSGFGDIKIADLNGDSRQQLVMGAAVGSEPVIRIASYNGSVEKEFFAYEDTFLGGISLALGDISGDGKKDIIVAPKTNGNGHIKVFDLNGNLIKEFAAYNRDYKGEVVLASGNIDGKGNDEIVLAFGEGAKSDIRLFSSEGKLIGAFYAFDETYLGGLEIEVANLSGIKDGGKAEIVVIPRKEIVSQVKIFSHHGKVINSFFAFGRDYKGGANLSVGDLNNNGINDIVVSAKEGAAPHVRVFNKNAIILESFYAWEERFSGGVKALALKINN